MAVKEFKSAKKSHKKIASRRIRLAVVFAVVALFAVTLFGCILPNYSAAAEYEEQINQLEVKKAALEAESEEISDSLENEMLLYEKIAREDYGYCKPGEKVFYRSSFGE